jgi:phosphoglycerol transferase MdoB-like AlkP superfamily enzyme
LLLILSPGFPQSCLCSFLLSLFFDCDDFGLPVDYLRIFELALPHVRLLSSCHSFVFLILLFYYSFKIIDRYYMPVRTKIISNAVTLLLLGLILIIAIRGGTQNRILSITNAYSQNKISGELKLNGVFTSLISIRSKTIPNKINISNSDALKIVENNLFDTDEEIVSDKRYPLMRQRIRFNINGKGYNIIFILLESWEKDYIDSIAGTNFRVTPNFDLLVKNSIMFDKFYANGQRSIMGLMSVFFSIP